MLQTKHYSSVRFESPAHIRHIYYSRWIRWFSFGKWFGYVIVSCSLTLYSNWSDWTEIPILSQIWTMNMYFCTDLQQRHIYRLISEKSWTKDSAFWDVWWILAVTYRFKFLRGLTSHQIIHRYHFTTVQLLVR